MNPVFAPININYLITGSLLLKIYVLTATLRTCFFLTGQVLINSKTEKSHTLRLQREKSLFCLKIFTHGVSNGIESKKWVKI